ncbi:MAG: glucosaminidase domain-containing protein [Pseudohaliea sp.]
MHCPEARHRAARGFLAAACLLLAACQGGSELPDLASVEDVPTLKRTFYGFLAPIVGRENDRIRAQREALASLRESLAAGEHPGWLARRRLRALAREYEVPWDPDNLPALASSLWRRVDVVPPALALTQAAKESGWGRSRFAVEGNNLFGQWCFEPGCGIVPARRPAGSQHEVAAFDSVDEAIRRYMNNLNTHERYAPFRERRAQLRASGSALTGRALVGGLLGYSERGEVYLDELRAMMRQNRALLDKVARG